VYFSLDNSAPVWTPDLPDFDPSQRTLYISVKPDAGSQQAKYLRPALTKGDGLIAAWRSWYQQFYTDAT